MTTHPKSIGSSPIWTAAAATESDKPLNPTGLYRLLYQVHKDLLQPFHEGPSFILYGEGALQAAFGLLALSSPVGLSRSLDLLLDLRCHLQAKRGALTGWGRFGWPTSAARAFGHA